MQTTCCEICNMKFKTEKYLKAQLKSKRHLMWSETKPKKQHQCNCGKIFSHRQSLYLHKKTCTCTHIDEVESVETLKTLIVEERQIHEQEIKSNEDKLEELKEVIKQLKADKSITNNNIETQNNNITINVNALGHENLDYITDKIMLKCIDHVHNSIPMLVNKLHFDPKHPENHNIKITNRRLPYMKVVNKKNEWEFANKKHTIEKLIDKSYIMLETTYEGYKDDMPVSKQHHFEQFQNNFNTQDNTTMKNLNQNVEMVIMNGQ